MHLVYEDVVPNMLKIWEGKFKRFDDRGADYQISSAEMEELAENLVKSGRIIPSTVVGFIENIVTRRSYWTANHWRLFTEHLGPIVLRGRLPAENYEHFLELSDLMRSFRSVSIPRDGLGELERRLFAWVEKFER
jgi:hypothetical protein